MSHLKISTRLILLTAFSVVLMVAVGGLGLWSNSKADQSLRTAHDERMVPVAQLSAVETRLGSSRVSLMKVLLNPTPDAIARGVSQVEAHVAEANKQWEGYLATGLSPQERKLADEFALLRDKYLAEALTPAIAALKSNDIAQARRLLIDLVPGLVAPVEARLAALTQLQFDAALAESRAATARHDTVRNLSAGLVGLGALLSWLFGSLIIRGIRSEMGTEPGTAASMLGAVAQGDLSARINVKPGDTTSLLARLSEMQRSLVGVVSHVRQNSEAVATASAQIAQGNLDLSQRTEEQASALEQTAASMEQLGSTVKQNAANAREANRLALGASTVAIKGGEVVSQVVTTMKGINDSSKKIADIISVIDGIAFQTNILALNAAVEAARAGEQGRGFAVVASEVRSLAGRSADAAREIKSLINASVVRVEHGTALVDQAGVTMTEVVASIKRVTDIMGEISAASSDQSSGVAQVAEALSQMDHVTQQNAALVEESAAAAESLKLQAHQLVQAVAVFKLSEAEHGTPAPLGLNTPATRPVWNSGERRGPDRARNVTRLGAKAQAGVTGSDASPARTGTDNDWTTF